MTDVVREKYARLMAQIEELEDRVADLDQQLSDDEYKGDRVLQQELRDLTEQLAQKRSELSRISDGCGKPHPMR
jgi:predicted  nucleic acid-binding Zn-ribbon protein